MGRFSPLFAGSSDCAPLARKNRRKRRGLCGTESTRKSRQNAESLSTARNARPATATSFLAANRRPPLTGGAFLSNWNGLTVGDLFDRIRKTMPQSGPGRLTRQQDADILAYVFSRNKFPFGKTELYRQSEMLKEIRFEAEKPSEKK